jgi:hypothetical protein
MRSQTFYEIASCAERNGFDFQELYRHKAAVAKSFGVADPVLKAETQQELRVLSGRGRPVIDAICACASETERAVANARSAVRCSRWTKEVVRVLMVCRRPSNS